MKRKPAQTPALPVKLAYDAVSDKGRRRAPSSAPTSEAVVLPQSKRAKMLGTVQDAIRNASTAAWMVRRHLDYVSRFRFSFRTGNAPLDRQIERMFNWHAQPRNFDIAGRLGREEMFRLFEMEKVCAGDAAILKIESGQLQAIESDLLAKPSYGAMKYRGTEPGGYESLPEEVKAVDHQTGAILSRQYPGRVDKWCICNRGHDGRQVAFDHIEAAENVIFDAYLTRFASQLRGVSPLSTAINSIQDLYEGFEWNLLKAKVHAIFGVAIMRDYSAGASTDQEEINQLGAVSGITVGATEALSDATATSPDGTKSVTSSLQQLRPDQMLMVDMESKGRIDTIESKTPSAEFQAFSELVLRVAMLALDIPYSAFNSSAASFSGIIADTNLYDVSCRWKREKNRWARQNYSDWLIDREYAVPQWGIPELAKAAGLGRREVQAEIEWVAAGAPWLMKQQEIQGDCQSMAAGIDNPIDICKRRGTDWFENVDKTAMAMEYAKAKGVSIVIGQPGQQPVVQNEKAKENE